MPIKPITSTNNTNPNPPESQPSEILQEAPLSSDTSSGNEIQSQPPHHDENYEANQNATNTSEYHVRTRSKNNIFKPKVFNVTNYPLPENLEPSNVRQAMQIPHWRQAISEEFDALIRNGTWSLVPPP